VQVQVEDGLPGVRSGVQDQAVATPDDPRLASQLPCHADQVAHQRFIFRGQVVDRARRRGTINVHRRDRVDISESCGLLVAVQDFARRLAGDDPAEDAVCSHAHIQPSSGHLAVQTIIT
jgi:hypothetical protein